jgi:hypothetical protein
MLNKPIEIYLTIRTLRINGNKKKNKTKTKYINNKLISITITYCIKLSLSYHLL